MRTLGINKVLHPKRYAIVCLTPSLSASLSCSLLINMTSPLTQPVVTVLLYRSVNVGRWEVTTKFLTVINRLETEAGSLGALCTGVVILIIKQLRQSEVVVT